MNESRSTRYHRARRRAAAVTTAVNAAVLTAVLVTPASRAVRDAAGGSAAIYAVALLLLLGAATFPLTWYRSFLLERQYELSRITIAAWAREYARSGVIRLAAGAAAFSLVYQFLSVYPRWWWVPAAVAGSLVMTILTIAAPVLILPRISRMCPLERKTLRERLAMLAARAGIQAPSVQAWRIGSRSRKAIAALVGAGVTRRILLSDTLLSDYSDDEIEAVLAHEIGHHVHRDVAKGLAAEFLLTAACCAASAVALDVFWKPIGLSSPADPAGAPLLLLVAGAVTLAATPVLNAVSRRNERRADEYAVDLCSRPDAFVSAMRRMAAQNLAEESPSRAAFLMFHTHPLVEERIALARDRSRARAS